MPMKRTSLFFDEDLIRQLKRVAAQRRVSVATLIREAVATYLAPAKGASLPSVAGRFASGRTDTSDRVDELLWVDPHK
jgi:hypothetical protein